MPSKNPSPMNKQSMSLDFGSDRQSPTALDPDERISFASTGLRWATTTASLERSEKWSSLAVISYPKPSLDKPWNQP